MKNYIACIAAALVVMASPIFAQSGITRIAGAPAPGTSEVQVVTIGGTPTAGSFKLTYDVWTTSAITWSATNATLLARVDAALEALPSIGIGKVTTAAGTLTAGIGTITLTFTDRQPYYQITGASSLTGTAPTLATSTTTAGVSPAPSGVPTGGLVVDGTNGVLYQNKGTAGAPLWSRVSNRVIATAVAAAGSAYTDAAALGAASIVVVSSDNAAKGVKLALGVASDVVYVINSSGVSCEIYPATGGTINGGAANAPVTIPASKGVLCVCTAADTWTVYELAAKAG